MIVAVHRLPRTTETLPARLMGRGRVLRAALEDLTALPPSAPLVLPLRDLLVRWRIALERAEVLTPAEEEFVMEIESAYDTWREQILQQGRAEGRAEGRAVGRAEGRAEGEVAAALRVLAARFGRVPPDLEANARSITDPGAASNLLDLALRAPTLAAVAAELTSAAPEDH